MEMNSNKLKYTQPDQSSVHSQSQNLGKQKQGSCYKFKASLFYVVNAQLAKITKTKS